MNDDLIVSSAVESEKKAKKKADEEYLHNIDINSLKAEMKMDLPEIAKLAGITENGVYKWAWPKSRQGVRPSFNAIARMLQRGATTKTLFGVETPVAPSEPQKIVLTEDLIAEMMLQAGTMLKKKK